MKSKFIIASYYTQSARQGLNFSNHDKVPN